MNATTTALVTGANKGLGRETVRRLAGLGWHVFLGARDAERGKQAAAELAEQGLDVEFVQLDVTSPVSITAAVAGVGARVPALDVLINNAGISGEFLAPQDTTAAHFRAVFETNVFAPVEVTHAFLPLLRAATQPRVVMVSSGMGSLTITSDPARLESTLPNLPYTSSKSALNMITSQYSRALPGIQVNAADPGYTATDFNAHAGHQTLTEGTDAIITLATLGPDGPTGGYFDRDGRVPW
ncbi:NAD(P)-dependent dehydrogenase (short-subunit alcohol dehydrogenase family) [Nocardia tenerifensis]|uniref:NAD(P)-dependent dehydrogenase (Short-subunit alcohol dehydrogenase family) n=1 Tax=Nocardia tenerifensis TaxID=228006 RepID=A0A318K9F3_9NOCA|nr:SDR family oxidoreductase [Nocardia tenerifensis]PXX70948.1 NAD(P)-dependent dehydrogenase (short-subunit alcohol dehydrogenase family) [Nocardia tenerifensis]